MFQASLDWDGAALGYSNRYEIDVLYNIYIYMHDGFKKIPHVEVYFYRSQMSI